MEELKITSKDNEKIKLLKKLKQSKYRNEFSRFFVENAVIICDALKAGVFFESLFVTPSFVQKNGDKFKFILEKSQARNYYLIDEKINKSFSDLETPPGICAVYLKREKKIDPNKPVIYLNAINDPGNAGTILRSALAFGLKNIVVDEKCADIYNHKAINAAKDAVFKLNIETDKDMAALSEIKKRMKVFSTRLEESDSVDILRRESVFCLVLGSESHGVSPEIQKISDGFIRIDMSGEIESLNVASAAAILFYEIYMQKNGN